MTDSETRDYQRVAEAIRFLEAHRLDQPDLDTVAAAVHLSPYHFQRLFTRWAGVSPRRFLAFLTAEHARAALAKGADVLAAALGAGLSGPGRLHDLLVTVEAVTPGEARRRGAGLAISYGFTDSPFGRCVVGATERGVCGLAFVTGDGDDAALEEIRARWPAAAWKADSAAIRPLADTVFAPPGAPKGPLPVHVSGTNFQIKVWEALMRVPAGHLVAYSELAAAVGCPKAARSVGTALAHNPIGYLIPCHRVIRETGVFSAYRWGPERKKAMVGWEMAKTGAQNPSTSAME